MEELRSKIGNDPYLKLLGIIIEEMDSGSATCSVIIREDMVNFLGVPHGGLIFSLADAALSIASNLDHSPSLAINISGSFLAKVKIGDTIVSKAKRIHQSHKTALYRMEIFHNNEIISTFNGTVYRSKK